MIHAFRKTYLAAVLASASLAHGGSALAQSRRGSGSGSWLRDFLDWLGGVLGGSTGGAGGTTAVPEIDPAGIAPALLLVLGGVAVLAGRRRTIKG